MQETVAEGKREGERRIVDGRSGRENRREESGREGEVWEGGRSVKLGGREENGRKKSGRKGSEWEGGVKGREGEKWEETLSQR